MYFNDYINCAIIFLVILVASALYNIDMMKEEYKNFDETRDGLEGIYYADNYYCVWTKDRTEFQISRVEIHEQCHHLVYLDKEHFCG